MSRTMKALGSGVAVASMLLLAACSSGEQTVTPDDNGATELNAEAQAALDYIAPFELAYDEFEAPGPALENLDQLAGKTVYYMPANQVVPMFGIIADSITEALGQFDINVQVCDAKANPQDA